MWLGQGLAEDKDTDGHVDLIAAFTRPGEVLLQSTPPGTPSSERMADNRSRLTAAGLDVVDFPILPTLEVGGEQVAVGHLNFYLCNGAAIVPVAGADRATPRRWSASAPPIPDREVVGVPGGVIAFGGGGPALHHPAGPGRAGVTAVPPWLDWGRRLAAIAREGLTWSREPFDRDRYERVAAVADELLAEQAGPALSADTLFPPGSGHPTPKVDVRAVVVRDGRVLPGPRAHRRRAGRCPADGPTRG